MAAARSGGRGRDEDLTPGHGQDEPPDKPASQPTTPAECVAELIRDFAGLEEVCRWQWNLVQRIKRRLGRLAAGERR